MKWLVYISVIILLGSCTEENLDPGTAYIEALADALDRPIHVQYETLPGFPRQRALRLAPPEMKIDAIQFAQLHVCDLGGLVGERNSGLGRLQTDSQRLAYELRWMQRAVACTQVAFVQQLLLEKRRALPVYVWNATVAGPEFAAAMSLKAGEPQVSSEPLVALADKVSAVLDQQLLPDGFEFTLQTLQQVRIGERRKRWAQARAVLDAARGALGQRTPPVCLSGQPNSRSRRLEQVLLRRYSQDWQVGLARSMREDVEWSAALARIRVSLAPVAPAEFVAFYATVFDVDNAASEWRRTKQALVNHAQAWQDFYAACGMTLGDRVGKNKNVERKEG